MYEYEADVANFAKYFDIYNLMRISKGATADQLKKWLISEGMPETSARRHIKEFTEDYDKGINAVKNQVKQLQDEKKEMKKNHLETQALCHSQQKYIEQLHEDIKAHQDKYVNLSVQLRLSEERIRTLKEQIEKGESLWHKLRKHVNWK